MTVPRRKRLSRTARLQSARKWIATYSGRDLVRGYRTWFGVSSVCAIVELRTLGVDNPERRLEEARCAERDQAARRAAQRARRTNPPSDSDGDFAFIAGYTDGGAPFGITAHSGHFTPSLRSLSLSPPHAGHSSPEGSPQHE